MAFSLPVELPATFFRTVFLEAISKILSGQKCVWKVNPSLIFIRRRPHYVSKNCLDFTFHTSFYAPAAFLRWLLVTVFATLHFSSEAQETTPAAAFDKTFAIGLNTGIKSIAGLDAGMTLSPRFNLRAGYNYADIKYYNEAFTVAESSKIYVVDAKYRFSHVEILGEYAPLRFLRIVFGAGIFFQNDGSIYVTPGAVTDFNDVQLTPEEVGYLKGEVTFGSKLSPYLGIALGKLVPKKRFGLSCDLGAYYKGDPIVIIEATELLSENTRNQPILDKNLDPYRFFPNISLRIAYRL